MIVVFVLKLVYLTGSIYFSTLDLIKDLTLHVNRPPESQSNNFKKSKPKRRSHEKVVGSHRKVRK